ncbi:unnamed protein product [Trichobilharzia regenti]|nr:unnamed protein product [Trichobilharzia regenti]
MEVSITVYSFSPYPQLDKISTGYRYLVYSISWCLIGLFTLFCYGLLRFLPNGQNKTNCSSAAMPSSSSSSSSSSTSVHGKADEHQQNAEESEQP